jgi:hypothetical protein
VQIISNVSNGTTEISVTIAMRRDDSLPERPTMRKLQLHSLTKLIIGVELFIDALNFDEYAKVVLKINMYASTPIQSDKDLSQPTVSTDSQHRP